MSLMCDYAFIKHHTIYVSNNKTINIKANGEDGSNVGTPYYGGHGGGAGGNIAYYTNEIVNDANLENLVDGGSGSDAVPGEYTNYATNGTNGENLHHLHLPQAKPKTLVPKP